MRDPYRGGTIMPDTLAPRYGGSIDLVPHSRWGSARLGGPEAALTAHPKTPRLRLG